MKKFIAGMLIVAMSIVGMAPSVRASPAATPLSIDECTVLRQMEEANPQLAAINAAGDGQKEGMKTLAYLYIAAIVALGIYGAANYDETEGQTALGIAAAMAFVLM